MSSAFAFAALCRCGTTACGTHKSSSEDGKVVLPPNIEPLHYNLDLTLRIDEHEFDGVVAIELDVKEAGLKSVALHAKELKLHSATMDSAGDATSIAVDEATSVATFAFGGAFPIGKNVLTIRYTGVHNDQMNGFYRSGYTDVHGNQKLMVSTQFESIDARKALPCWDEPRRKASFTCSLTVPAHMTALSNMPERSTRAHADGTKRVTFMRSPRMSTYLLAFVVGEFDHVAGLTKNGVLVRVFCPPGKPQLGEFALECGLHALDSYDEAFGHPYPLPKSDMVAIPDFAMGAMENWGLVTYREVDLLIDEAASSRQRQRVAEVVMHELAHQWFGNLVTMEWWDDLWLNEGFATWMQTHVTDKLYPHWRMWDQFITDMQYRALSLDALLSSHPIQVPIGRAEEVDQVFDAISYCKGGSVVRMVHSVVGERAFFDGLRAYMAEFKYGNATTDDLWAAWETASEKPVKELMGKWTKQMGFPLLEVESCDAAGAGGGKVALKLTQRWFLADGSTPAEKKTWPIPLFARASAGAPTPEPMSLMQGETHTLTLQGDGRWVKLNAGQYVPLHVKYPDAMMGALAEAVRSKAIDAVDRVGLLADQAALCKAGLLAPTSYLELLAAFEAEDEPIVLGEATAKLQALHSLLAAVPELQRPYDAIAKRTILKALGGLGWDARADDGHLTRKVRGELMSALPAFCADDAAVVAEARRRFALYVADESADKVEGKRDLPPEIALPVMKIVMLNGGEAEYAQLLSLFRTLALNDDKKQALMALGAQPTDELRRRALDFSTSGEVKLQDLFYLALSMQSSQAGAQIAWEYFQANLAKYLAMYKTASPSLLDACITGACGMRYGSEAQVAELKAFFDAHKDEFVNNQRKIAQTIESNTTNCAYVGRFKASDALAWLTAHAPA